MNNKRKPAKGVDTSYPHTDTNQPSKRPTTTFKQYYQGVGYDSTEMLNSRYQKEYSIHSHPTIHINKIQSYPSSKPTQPKRGDKESFFKRGTRWVRDTRLRGKLVNGLYQSLVYIDNFMGIGRAVKIADYFFPRVNNKCYCSACERYRKESGLKS